MLGITLDGRSVTWSVPEVMHRYDARNGAERPPIPIRPNSQAFILPGDRLLEVSWRHVRISDLATGRTIDRGLLVRSRIRRSKE